MVLSVILAAILDFLRDSWPGLGTWNSSKQKWYFEHKSQVCVSAVHPDMMYNPDKWDFICYFGALFVFQFWKGKTKNRAWHGADLESAYISELCENNCMTNSTKKCLANFKNAPFWKMSPAQKVVTLVLTNVGTFLRRWLRISPILFQRLVLAGYNEGKCRLHVLILHSSTTLVQH